MNDTRGVFDAVMKDIDQLQSETEKLQESKAIDELEAHLTERMALLSENNLETCATHRETINTLSTSLEKYQKKFDEGKDKQKKNLKEI